MCIDACVSFTQLSGNRTGMGCGAVTFWAGGGSVEGASCLLKMGCGVMEEVGEGEGVVSAVFVG